MKFHLSYIPLNVNQLTLKVRALRKICVVVNSHSLTHY